MYMSNVDAVLCMDSHFKTAVNFNKIYLLDWPFLPKAMKGYNICNGNEFKERVNNDQNNKVTSFQFLKYFFYYNSSPLSSAYIILFELWLL